MRLLGASRRVVLRVVAAAVELILRAVSGGAVVRIGRLNGKGKISIMIAYIEPFIRRCRRDGRRHWLIVLNPGPDPNAQLTTMYRRQISLYDATTPIRLWLFGLIYRLAAAARSPLDAQLCSAHSTTYLAEWSDPVPALAFTDEEERRGRDFLANMGIAEGEPHMCFGLRESSFYAGATYRDASTDTVHRNPTLEGYLPAVQHCLDAGLHVIRAGIAADHPVPLSHPRLHDYATNGPHMPFADVFMLAKARFTLAGAAGLWWFSSAFNRPTVVTDCYTLWTALRPDDLFTPRLIWDRRAKRLLTFREMLERGQLYIYEGNCERDEVELVPNSPDELVEAAREMISRLDGTWQATDEDEELQRRFKALYPVPPSRYFDDFGNFYRHMNISVHGRMAAFFLRRHQALLG